jgi:hypothetical protein
MPDLYYPVPAVDGPTIIAGGIIANMKLDKPPTVSVISEISAAPNLERKRVGTLRTHVSQIVPTIATEPRA